MAILLRPAADTSRDVEKITFVVMIDRVIVAHGKLYVTHY